MLDNKRNRWMICVPNNFTLRHDQIYFLGKDVHRCEEDQKFKHPDENLDSARRHKITWFDPTKIYMLENAMENFRMCFNVVVFDLNSNRVRENSCTCEFCCDDLLSSSSIYIYF